jgi:hypothetical protein
MKCVKGYLRAGTRENVCTHTRVVFFLEMRFIIIFLLFYLGIIVTGMYEFVLNKRQACMAHVCFVSVVVPSKKTVQTVPSIHN